MRFCRPIIAFALLLAATALPALAASSADLPHVHVQLISPDAQLHPGTANKAGLYFKLEPGWHVYWKNPGDAGEPPHIKWTLPAGITAGPLQFPVPKRLPLGPLMDFGYEDEVLFPIQLNVADSAPAGPAVLHAKVDWLVCRGSCIPEKTELEITRQVASAVSSSGTPVQPDHDIWARLASKLPQAIPANLKVGFVPTPTGFRLTAITGHREAEASFFPVDADILSNPAPQTATPTANGLTLDLKKDENLAANPKELRGLLQLPAGRAFELIASAGAPSAPKPIAPEPVSAQSASTQPAISPIAPVPSAAIESPPANSATTEGPSLLRAVALAFLGGLLLNLMPCVFPVLFIKGLSLVQSGNEERHKL
ncbi:MAG: protein-disulfide reductase DsbD domain-containing protein, partial [Terracidiphilus sp.]